MESATSPGPVEIACLTAIEEHRVGKQLGVTTILIPPAAGLKVGFAPVAQGTLQENGHGTGENASDAMMATNDALHLALDAEPDSIGFARTAVADFGQSLGMVEPQLGDLKTVVSEACTNVVRHAYPGDRGQFELDARPEAAGLMIVVRDFGVGLRPLIQPEGRTMRLGLGLIATLSARYEIFGHPEGGTEVRITMPLR